MEVNLQGLCKSFESVEAVRDVTLTIRSGEVLALMGDNGAGKSTLIKMLSGAIPVDRGQIVVDDVPKVFASPSDARDLGIETLYQDLGLFDRLDVACNFFMGRELVTIGGFLRTDAMRERARDIVSKFSVRDIPVDQSVIHLSGGQRQITAVSRTVGFGSRLVILDEPTAALSPTAASEVIATIERLKADGIGVIFITHNLAHAFAIADRIAVMYLGRLAGERRPADVQEKDIVALIVGAGMADSPSA